MKSYKIMMRAVLTTALAAGAAAQTHADVTLSNRLSRVSVDIAAGAGGDMDRLLTELSDTSLVNTFDESPSYDAYAEWNGPSAQGCGRASGTTSRLDDFVFGPSGLLQARSTMTAYGEAEHLWGTGNGTASYSHNYRIDFELSEDTDIRLEGMFLPSYDPTCVTCYAEVRLHKVGVLPFIDEFFFTTLFDDQGPYLFEETLEAGGYWLEVDMQVFSQRLSTSVPTFTSNTVSYTMTLTFGDGPCPQDVDNDGSVGVGDLLQTLGDWGKCAACDSDQNGDGMVGVTELLAILGAWGPCP